MKDVIVNLKETYGLLRSKPFYLVVPAFLDLLFLFLLGFFGSIIGARAVPYFQRIAEIQQGTFLRDIAASDPTAFAQTGTEIALYTASLLQLFSLIMIMTLVLWIIFQGINWYLASSVVSKVSWKKYVLNFFLLSVVVSIILFILVILFFQAQFQQALVGGSNLKIPFVITLIVLSYFLFIGYALAGKYNFHILLKEIFVKGVKNFVPYVSMYVVAGVLMLIAHYIIKLLALSGIMAFMLVIGSVIVFPLLAFIRVYIIRSV